VTGDAQHDDPKAGFIGVLAELAAASGPDGLTLGEIIDRLDERAFGLMIFILAIPCLVPGLPGAQVIAVPIFLLACQMALGRSEPWLPKRFLALRVKKDWLDLMAGFAAKRLAWAERVARPRLTLFAAGIGERLTAVAVALASVTIMLPLTNTIPSLGVTLASIGVLQRDGLFALAGMAICMAWTLFLVAVPLGAILGVAFFSDIMARLTGGA
jgi:hypothetical protein